MTPMAGADRGRGTPEVPVLLPSWLDPVFRYLNPVMKRLARYLPIGASVVEHRGRRSGKRYETVVTAYRSGDRLLIGLGHGEADWVKNVLAAGEADVRLFRRRVHIVNPRILPALPATGGDDSVPRVILPIRRRVAVLVADIDGHRR